MAYKTMKAKDDNVSFINFIDHSRKSLAILRPVEVEEIVPLVKAVEGFCKMDPYEESRAVMVVSMAKNPPASS